MVGKKHANLKRIILYHVTPKRKLSSILESGLLPNQRACIGKERKQFYNGVQPIFLCNDPVRLADEQLGRLWIAREKAVILIIDCSGLVLIDEYHWTDPNIASNRDPLLSTWVCMHQIFPDRIIGVSCFTGEVWAEE